MGSAFTFYGGQNQLQKKIHESGTLDYSEILASVQSDGAYEETAFYYSNPNCCQPKGNRFTLNPPFYPLLCIRSMDQGRVFTYCVALRHWTSLSCIWITYRVKTVIIQKFFIISILLSESSQQESKRHHNMNIFSNGVLSWSFIKTSLFSTSLLSENSYLSLTIKSMYLIISL